MINLHSMMRQAQREESSFLNSATEQTVEGGSNTEDSATPIQVKDTGCIISHLKKKYHWYFVVLATSLIILMIFEMVFRYYLLVLREKTYENNIEVLQTYREWEINNYSPNLTQKYKEKKDVHLNTQSQLEKQFVNLNETEMIKTQAAKITTIQKQPRAEKINPVIQRQQANVPPSPQLPASDLDYQNYTGITVNQVSNSLIWMQLKYLDFNSNHPLVASQQIYYEQKYGVSRYEELPICVVVSTFNNAQNNRHINNINSILMQDYQNYHLVFIDDGSDDSTADDIIRIMVQQQKLDQKRYVMIKNNEQQMKLYNLRMAANSYCEPHDIFIVVDGDDELIGRQVFKLFNAMFQEHGAWFVYSNFMTLNNYVGFSRYIPPNVIKNNSYRQYPFVTSHLRAFYTQLFRNVKDQDLRDSYGEYYSVANDVATCLPILQQSQERVHYIPEITYFYNGDTGHNNHKLHFKEQKSNDLLLRSHPKYERLGQLYN